MKLKFDIRFHILASIIALTALPGEAAEAENSFVSDPARAGYDLSIPTAAAIPDSVALGSDTLAKTHQWLKEHDALYRAEHNWINLARRRALYTSDTTVIYPRFIDFCMRVYRWADHAFNSYNPEYVEGTGKRWKARLAFDNWVDSYSMHFPGNMNMRMMSDIYANAGAYIQYMAVSVGYSANLNHMFGGDPIDRKRLEFGFNCARFNLDVYYTENNGGTYMRTFGDYKNGHIFKNYFPGLELHSFNVDLYYFLNNKKYSQGAAYNNSKIQKRSAGSFIFGLSYSNLDISLDFSTLDPILLPYFTMQTYFMKFHYYNYCLLFGYGHNFVLNKHFLFNITALPSIGVNHCYEDSAEGSGNLLSLNIKGRMSLTYNYRNLYAGLIAKMDGNWYHSNKISFFNSIENAQINVGIRF